MGHSTRYCIAFTAVLLGVALRSQPAVPQDDPEERLTGGSSRAWVLQRFVQPAGPGSACSSGKIYTFAVTHDLIVSRCTNGQIVPSHYTWSISGRDAGDPTLMIDGMGAFLLSFHRPGAGTYRMRLRAKGTAQTPGIDEEFSLDED